MRRRGITFSAIIFDMDGTLYESEQIRRKFAEAACHTLAKFRNISVEQAQRLLNNRRERLSEQYGESVPYTLTLKSLGVPIAFWHEQNIGYFDPGKYLKADSLLMNAIFRLKEHYKLAVITNNNSIQTERTLEALGLHGVFDKVFTYNSFNLLKPDPVVLKKATDEMQVRPDRCLMVGDRFNVDLLPAKKMGMHIYEVRGPRDIEKLSKTLLSHNPGFL